MNNTITNVTGFSELSENELNEINGGAAWWVNLEVSIIFPGCGCYMAVKNDLNSRYEMGKINGKRDAMQDARAY